MSSMKTKQKTRNKNYTNHCVFIIILQKQLNKKYNIF